MLTTPRPQGQGKRRSDRGGGIAKRPSRRRRSAGTSRRSPGPAASGIDQGGAAGGLLDPVRLRAVLRHRAPVHAGAHGSLRVRSRTYKACPSPRKVTGGRPTLDRLVEMSTDGGRVACHGVRRTTNGRGRGGGPDYYFFFFFFILQKGIHQGNPLVFL